MVLRMASSLFACVSMRCHRLLRACLLGEPVKDFEEMIGRTDYDLWEKAIKEMTSVIHELVSTSVLRSSLRHPLIDVRTR